MISKQVKDDELIQTTLVMRGDQIRAIEKLINAQRSKKTGKKFGRTARAVIDAGLQVITPEMIAAQMMEMETA